MGTPALHRLRGTLADARARGEPFDAVWRSAVWRAIGSDADLQAAVTDTADAWRRAFEGQPATPSETAASRLYGLWAEDDMERLNGRGAQLAP
jgi:hypothetical protein